MVSHSMSQSILSVRLLGGTKIDVQGCLALLRESPVLLSALLVLQSRLLRAPSVSILWLHEEISVRIMSSFVHW